MKRALIPIGTIRIGTNLKIYEKTKHSWRLSKKEFPEAQKTIELFKVNKNFKELINPKSPGFLKGQLSPKGNIQGARLNILPNSSKIDKSYSLLAKKLTFHDESSHDHWDVIYENPNGKFAYCYTLEKKNKSTEEKYLKVNKFERIYPKLEKNVELALKDESDIYAVPMYTLLKTYMRVGNEMNYKANGHKGLTTLTKKDISIKNNQATFNYIAKSGVPMKIVQDFPQTYIKRLKEAIRNKKNSEFIFTNESNKPLKDTDFMRAFENYCGEKFYPHIVRSFYATKKAKDFLQDHKKAEKDEIKDLFTEIAEKLGHKRYDKKNNEWKDSYTVTIHHYIQPDLVNKIQNLIR